MLIKLEKHLLIQIDICVVLLLSDVIGVCVCVLQMEVLVLCVTLMDMLIAAVLIYWFYREKQDHKK